MKKKWLLGLMALTMAFATMGFVGCGESDGANDGGNTEQNGGTIAPDGGGEGSGGDETPISYTVTYEANGGTFSNGATSITDTVEENGKLTAPEKPSRNNYAFTYWYKDGALNDIWDFSTDTVTQEITLYAGWQSTIVDYDVTFVLNYQGATRETIKTVDGLITYMPKRTGYVFNGWWLADGMTADGEYILAQKWNMEDLVTQEGLVLYAEWVEEATQASQLTAPSVTINENTFAWSPVNKAVRYDIRVYQSGIAEAIITETTTNTTWVFPKSYEAGYYNVNIRAIGDGVNTVNSVFATKRYAHKILASASNIQFDLTTSVVTWESVRHATSYDIYVDNVLKDTVTHTTYDMSLYEAGTYNLKIIAISAEYQQSIASTSVKKVRIKTPTMKVYGGKDTNDYVLVWDEVLCADTYILDINGQKVNVVGATTYNINKSSYRNGRIVVKLTAFDSNADWLISNETNTIELQYISLLTININDIDAGSLSAGGEFYIKHGVTVGESLLEKETVLNNFGSSDFLVSLGTNITLTATTNKGYIWLGWYSGGELISTDTTYTFTMKGSDVTYQARWNKIHIKYDREKGGILGGDATYLLGDEIVVKASTHIGYVFDGWYSGDILLTDEETLTFTAVEEDVEYQALWSLDDSLGLEKYSFISTKDTCIIRSLNDKSIRDIVIPECVTGIRAINTSSKGDYLLSSIKIHSRVTLIEAGAFKCLPELISITVSDENPNYKDIDGNLYTKDGSVFLQYTAGRSGSSFTLPGSVKEVAIYAFSWAYQLTKINLANVNKIEYCAFHHCYNLETITIPGGVSAIGARAFDECQYLTNIVFSDTSTWYKVFRREDWENKKGGTNTNVASSSQNAEYFTDVYRDYYWYKL